MGGVVWYAVQPHLPLLHYTYVNTNIVINILMNEELPIIQKTFNMLLWLLPKTDKFPRKREIFVV